MVVPAEYEQEKDDFLFPGECGTGENSGQILSIEVLCAGDKISCSNVLGINNTPYILHQMRNRNIKAKRAYILSCLKESKQLVCSSNDIG